MSKMYQIQVRQRAETGLGEEDPDGDQLLRLHGQHQRLCRRGQAAGRARRGDVPKRRPVRGPGPVLGHQLPAVAEAPCWLIIDYSKFFLFNGNKNLG